MLHFCSLMLLTMYKLKYPVILFISQQLLLLMNKLIEAINTV